MGSAPTSRIVQDTFGKVFNEGTEFQRDGCSSIACSRMATATRSATLAVQVLHTPGHTPACTTHVVGNAAFVGDTLFMPDGGSARADFPGGDAATLYRSIRRLLTLPDQMRLFMCHDYGPNGRDIMWETTVGEERRHNIHVHDGISEADFVATAAGPRRDARHAQAHHPVPAGQHAGRRSFPPKDEAGKTFLKVPVNEL